jgi:hypothetical protein
LAEALRPALDLIHESVPPEESWGLPGYWDDVPPGEPPTKPSGEPPVTVKPRPQLAVRRMRLPSEAKARRKPRREQWRLVAIAAVAGACAALAVLGVAQVLAPRGGSAANSPEVASLVPIVWPPVGEDYGDIAANASAENLSRDLQACGRCHKPGGEHYFIRPATHAIAMTCFECHEFAAHN